MVCLVGILFASVLLLAGNSVSIPVDGEKHAHKSLNLTIWDDYCSDKYGISKDELDKYYHHNRKLPNLPKVNSYAQCKLEKENIMSSDGTINEDTTSWHLEVPFCPCCNLLWEHVKDRIYQASRDQRARTFINLWEHSSREMLDLYKSNAAESPFLDQAFCDKVKVMWRLN